MCQLVSFQPSFAQMSTCPENGIRRQTLIQSRLTEAYQTLVLAGQVAYAESYPWVYYVSLAFGCLSIICSVFLGDIKKHMTDHVAVHMDKVPTGRHHLHHNHTEQETK